MRAMNNSYEPRFYRNITGTENYRYFSVAFKETDLWIGVDAGHYRTGMEHYALKNLKGLRSSLEGYIQRNRDFLYSLAPCGVPEKAPDVVLNMARAAVKARVGPMAAVAGAFAQQIGKSLERAYGLKEIIVENGGDIYINTKRSLTFSVYAGESALSNKVVIGISPYLTPAGICTSSGTVGHSLSFGIADAVTVICRDAALADAYATYFCNAVRPGKSIEDILELSLQHRGIMAILIISENRFGLRGDIELFP